MDICPSLWRCVLLPFREMVIYKENDPIYHSKMLTFYRKEPFGLEARYHHMPSSPIIGRLCSLIAYLGYRSL